MSDSFISIDKLSKVYASRDGGSVNAIEDVSFEVGKGEFVSIVGPSGCGKSTLLKIVGGLLQSSGGTLTYKDLPANRKRPELGMVFQDPVLLPWRNIARNVALPTETRKTAASEADHRADVLLDLVGLSGFGDKYPSELSGGMQQRASIARALINDPALLLMDEPFGALDALTRETMALELQRIWTESRKTILFVTHSISEAVFLSDRVVVMSARPATIAGVIKTNLPRPRTFEMAASAAFADCTMQIRKLLSATGAL